MFKKRRPVFLHALFLILFLGAPALGRAGKYYDFSPRAQEAYRLAFSLRLKEAEQALEVLAQQEPDNLIGIFLGNYVEVLRIGVDDDEAAYRRLSGHMDDRLYQLSRGEPRSPYYRYTQAETRLQWAVLRARFGDYLACLSDIKQAYALLEENDRRFPEFIANKKSLGIIHALVGNVPDDYRWAIRLLSGMSGTLRQGLAEIESVPAQQPGLIFEDEAVIGYAILQLHFNNQGEKAWNALKNSKLDLKSNPLAAFIFAHTALRTGRTDQAIQILKNSPAGAPYHPFYQRDYLLGIAKLYRLDADANQPLQSFLYHFKGKNSIKEAYQKLGWHFLMQGNTTDYYNCMWNVKQYGVSRSDPDKVALREAESGEMPDLRLLQARLLFDGAYYVRAFDVLKNVGVQYASHPRNNLEYHYRMGRIAHKLGKNADAVRFYRQTIDLGASRPWYFACNAALQLGLLYEDQKDAVQARLYYQKCLAISPEEYSGSLHTKAKAGLSRLR